MIKCSNYVLKCPIICLGVALTSSILVFIYCDISVLSIESNNLRSLRKMPQMCQSWVKTLLDIPIGLWMFRKLGVE